MKRTTFLAVICFIPAIASASYTTTQQCADPLECTGYAAGTYWDYDAVDCAGEAGSPAVCIYDSRVCADPDAADNRPLVDGQVRTAAAPCDQDADCPSQNGAGACRDQFCSETCGGDQACTEECTDKGEADDFFQLVLRGSCGAGCTCSQSYDVQVLTDDPRCQTATVPEFGSLAAILAILLIAPVFAYLAIKRR